MIIVITTIIMIIIIIRTKTLNKIIVLIGGHGKNVFCFVNL